MTKIQAKEMIVCNSLAEQLTKFLKNCYSAEDTKSCLKNCDKTFIRLPSNYKNNSHMYCSLQVFYEKYLKNHEVGLMKLEL